MDTTLENKNIINLFDNPNNDLKNLLNSLLDVDIDKLTKSAHGRSEFKLIHFTALNEREAPNDYLKYEQVKLEYNNMIQLLFDLMYQYNKANADLLVVDAEIDDLNNKNQTNPISPISLISPKMKEAKLAQQLVEKHRLNYQIFNIKRLANVKLNELIILKKLYDQYKYIDNLPQEQINQMEEEGYRIKSAYFQELVDRYGLTPQGFLKYPHQDKGLDGILELYTSNNNKLPLSEIKED